MLWWGALGAGLAWLVLLAVLARVTDPRRVGAGESSLELGDEPPALVNLLTSDWELTSDAGAATILDLAARRHLEIADVGGQTFVRARTNAGRVVSPLAAHEELVLDHVRRLSARTSDGFVPAAALTTGSEDTAARWWRSFEEAVVELARRDGLSRARWGGGARQALVAGALLVGLAVFAAGTTLPPTKEGDDPIGAAIGFGVLAAAALIAVASRLRGERDTPKGRVVAARWLGVRTMLADDPVFAAQPPAAVAIWDRVLAHGAALGVAHAAAQGLPLGAEHERRAWSSMGGRWRPVRVRYPDVLPPGYGRSPAVVALVGALLTAFVVASARGGADVVGGFVDVLRDLPGEQAVPPVLRVVLFVLVGFAAAVVVALGVAALSMLVCGVHDLVRRRREVEGLVLRVRTRGTDDRRYWHVAVDDGTRPVVRAWRVGDDPPVAAGTMVRAAVSPWLGHVRDLRPVPSAVAPGERPTAEPAAPTGVAVPALPGADVVARLVAEPVRAVDAPAHPLARDGASRTFVTADGTRVLVAWVTADALGAVRSLVPQGAAPLAQLGDEAYRARVGGGVVARVGPHTLLVAAAPAPGRAGAEALPERLARGLVPA